MKYHDIICVYIYIYIYVTNSATKKKRSPKLINHGLTNPACFPGQFEPGHLKKNRADQSIIYMSGESSTQFLQLYFI